MSTLHSLFQALPNLLDPTARLTVTQGYCNPKAARGSLKLVCTEACFAVAVGLCLRLGRPAAARAIQNFDRTHRISTSRLTWALSDCLKVLHGMTRLRGILGRCIVMGI